MIAIQVIGHVKIIVGSRCITALLQLLDYTEAILPNGHVEEDSSR